MDLTSSSICAATCSEYGLACAIERPMKISSWPDSNEIEPSLSLMPYTVTILRAICEARWMSFDAPVEMSPSISFSATRPPSSETICSSI